eukprot:327929_1
MEFTRIVMFMFRTKRLLWIIVFLLAVMSIVTLYTLFDNSVFGFSLLNDGDRPHKIITEVSPWNANIRKAVSKSRRIDVKYTHTWKHKSSDKPLGEKLNM